MDNLNQIDPIEPEGDDVPDYTQAIRDVENAGPELAAVNLGENPETGVRAIQLAQATGLPPAAVYNDPEFDNVVRLQTATNIIRGNSYINQYIQGSPMASIVSNDDYGNLDEFSQSAQNTMGKYNPVKILVKAHIAAAEAAVEGFAEGWGGPLSEATGYKPIDDLMATPGSASGALYRFMYLSGQLGLKALGGTVKGVIEGIGTMGESLYEQIIGDLLPSSIDPYGSKGFGRELKAIIEMELNRPPIAAGISAAGVRQFKGAQFARAMENPEIGAAVKAEPWVSAGKEPPAGIHPYLDKLKADANTEALTSLERDLAIAAQSATRERAPELFQQFAEQHYGNSTIGIAGDRIAELYRDRIPDPNDGLLGWVDGIADKLEAARLTGEDVYIPTAAWVSRVDPAIAKALNEDIRMWPGGITAREATVVAEARPVIDGALPQVRDVADLEPMFANGDRKVELRKHEKPFSDFQDQIIIHDAEGKPAGYIIIEPRAETKTLYIDMIQGADVNGFGPAAIRDLKRQLKEMYPEYETITGHRVSGARGHAGTWDGPTAHPEVKLNIVDGAMESVNEFTAFQNILRDSELRQFHPNVNAYIPDMTKMPEVVRGMNDIVAKEIGRLTGGQAIYKPASRIQATKGRFTRGVFMQYRNQNPIILVDLFTNDAVGTARHESIHMLRQYGFFKDGEYAALVKAAREEGWIQRYDIDTRYPKASEFLKLEEAIAEGFRDWAKNRNMNTGVKTPVTGVFERMAELWERLKVRFAELLGKQEIKWEDLFEQVYKGEIGARTDFKPRAKGVFDPRLMTEPTDVAQRMETLKANATGLDVKTYRKLQEQIQARFKEDLEAARERAEKLEKKTLTSEWRENLKGVKAEVEETIRQRPDVAADLFFGSGELHGTKIRQRYSLNIDDLTPEQAAALPKQYVSKSGLPADATAQLFGFPNKDALVEALVAYNKERGTKSSQDFLRDQVNAEAARVMQQRYGNLDDNIMTAAADRAFSETNLNLIAEELQAAAMQAGVKVIDKDVARAEAERLFANMKVSDIRSDKLMANVGKHGRDAERALINGDQAGALVSLQKKYLTSLITRMAIDMEKARVDLDKIAKPYQTRETKGPAPEFIPYVQQLLQQAGYKTRLSPEQVARGIEFHGEGSLEKFVDRVFRDGYEPIVSDSLIREGAKPLDQMTAAEFSEFHDAIKSLNWIGRKQQRVELDGAARDFAAYKAEVISNIQQLPARSRAEQKEGAGRWVYQFDGWLTRTEEVIKDLDLRKELGPLWSGVMHQMETSKSKFNTMAEDLAKYFNGIEKQFGRQWRKSLDDTIENNVIWDPHNGTMYDMTRENLIQVMLNWGSRSNIEKFAGGAFFVRFKRRATKEELGLMEAAIKQMIDKHATKEDWDFVKHMWEPFKKWQPEMDRVARNTTGIAPKLIKPEKVMTKFGEIEGGYWPVKYDKLGSNMDAIKDRASGSTLMDERYFRAATAKSHLKDRTGYVDFVDISRSLEQAAGTMQQTMHDIAYREAVGQAAKILFDKDIKTAIKKHYGVEYDAQMEPWLKRISYQYSMDDRAASAINSFLRRMRVNLVGHTLPFNYKVILSPDMGVPNPVTWARFTADYKNNMKFVMENSKEVKHLVYNLDRDYSDAMAKVVNNSGFDQIRRKAVEWGYAIPVKMSQQFRAATFWNEYQRAMAKGMTKEQAIAVADSYVRQQHGTASIADSSAMMNPNSEAMKMLTVFQGYFNMQYNWQRQIPGQIRRGEYARAIEAFAGTYGVNIALGALLFNQAKENDSWFKIVAKSILMAPFQMIPVGNSAAAYFGEGFNPRVPFASLITATDSVIKDAKKWYQGKKVEKPITHGANIVGLSTGLPLGQIGKTAQFTYDVNTGRQRPRNIIEYVRGFQTGEARLKK